MKHLPKIAKFAHMIEHNLSQIVHVKTDFTKMLIKIVPNVPIIVRHVPVQLSVVHHVNLSELEIIVLVLQNISKMIKKPVKNVLVLVLLVQLKKFVLNVLLVET